MNSPQTPISSTETSNVPSTASSPTPVTPKAPRSELESDIDDALPIETPFFGKRVTKEAICKDWLPRYTGQPLEYFSRYILLCNFHKYVHLFAEMYNVEVVGLDKPIQCATANGITIMNFGMGSAAAATCVDLLSAIKPKAILFLGKCGGLKKTTRVGDYILPIAAIRGEGTSNDYLDPLVPALPAFALQKAVSTTLRDFSHTEYLTGTVYTTNTRVWEHNEVFKQKLRSLRCYCIDMETASIFIVAFANKIPAGALLLVSDQPMISEGIKSSVSDQLVTQKFVDDHLLIGIESLKQLQNSGHTLKHLRF